MLAEQAGIKQPIVMQEQSEGEDDEEEEKMVRLSMLELSSIFMNNDNSAS